MSNEVVVGAIPTLIKKKHELAKLQKAVHQPSLEAVDLLSEIMRDKNQDIELRAKVAKLLVEIDIKVNVEVSKDSLTRQIAQLKINQQSGINVSRGKGEPERKAPKLDFLNIQEVE